ncbi:bacterial non-heme ferritin [Salvia divinorum]|uniref:Ferritin n=1 Tax=Salvia divinorum TaxID=28513 RepID=A0ABD1GYP8_SALDI
MLRFKRGYPLEYTTGFRIRPRARHKPLSIWILFHFLSVVLPFVVPPPYQNSPLLYNPTRRTFKKSPTPDVSIARQKFSQDCESAIYEHINMEYCVSYVYHTLYAYFDGDNIALKGLAKFFKEASVEKREHVEKLMEYQNKQGGRVCWNQCSVKGL